MENETNTTQPGAENVTETNTAQPEVVAGSTQEQTSDDPRIAKANREAQKYRQQLRELQDQIEQQKQQAELETLSDIEKLQKQLAVKDDEIAQLDQELLLTRREFALARKVVNTKAAMKLIEDEHLDDKGNVDVEALLQEHPYLAIKSAEGVNIPDARSLNTKTYTLEQVRNMSPEQIKANWTDIKKSLNYR